MNEPLEAKDLPEIDEVLADPAASYWLKAALRSALSRDPLDAAHDSDTLADYCTEDVRKFFSPKVDKIPSIFLSASC